MSNSRALTIRDHVWEEVLELLSSQGRLNKFFKLPRHEKRALLQLYGQIAYENLGHVFVLTQKRDYKTRTLLLGELGEFQIYAMLNVMVRSMQCWAETDGTLQQKAPSRWKVANA